MNLYDEPNYKLHEITIRMDKMAEEIVQSVAGISYGQYLALVAVGEAGIHTVTGVAAWLNIKPPTSSHLCHKLEKTGHIQIKVSDESLRKKRMTITGKGERVLGQVNPVLEEAFAYYFRKIPSPEQKQFIHTLDQLLSELRKGENQ